jgi:hypothetical protein
MTDVRTLLLQLSVRAGITFLACDRLLRGGKYTYMASVVTLASDEKQATEFTCRRMLKEAFTG